MSVLERLRGVAEPLWSDIDYEEWTPFADADLRAVTWRPTVRVRLVSVLLKRVREASRGWSLRHMFRRVQAEVVASLRLSTPEMAWFCRYPENAKPSGREMKWGAS